MSASFHEQSDAADTSAHTVATDGVGDLVDRIARSPDGTVTHVVVIVPPDAARSPSAYDLAMGISDALSRRERRGAAELTLVTPESTPEATLDRLTAHGICVLAGRVARDWAWGRLLLDDETTIPADRLIEMPPRVR